MKKSISKIMANGVCNTSAVFTLMATVLLASCAKVSGNGNDADWTPLSFSTNTEDEIEVKSERQTTVTNFTAGGWDSNAELVDLQWFFEPANVNTSQTYPVKWKNGKEYTFFAYANLPTDLETGAASAQIGLGGGVTLSYTVPVNAEEHTDIMVGHYSGNGGGKGEAEINFIHPMAAVVFQVGDMPGVKEIWEISLSGIVGSSNGMLKANNPSNFTWITFSPYETSSVFQVFSGDIPAKGSQLGTPFFLIPQTISENDIIVNMHVKLTSGQEQDVIATLPAGAFEAGKTNVYTINYSAGGKLWFRSSVTAWNHTAEQEMDLEKARPTREIASYADLLAFKTDVENGVDMDGYKILFTNNIDEESSFYCAINDSHGVLDNAIIDGNEKTISFTNIVGNNNYVGLFGLISSSNIAFKDITLDNCTFYGGGYLVSECTGSYISFENIEIKNCHPSAITQDVGGIIGHISGDASFDNCRVLETTISSGCSNIGGILGSCSANSTITFTKCTVSGCTIGKDGVAMSTQTAYLSCGGTTKSIKVTDCKCDNNTITLVSQCDHGVSATFPTGNTCSTTKYQSGWSLMIEGGTVSFMGTNTETGNNIRLTMGEPD